MKNSQMKSTNDTIDKLQKSRDFLDKKYPLKSTLKTGLDALKVLVDIKEIIK